MKLGALLVDLAVQRGGIAHLAKLTSKLYIRESQSLDQVTPVIWHFLLLECLPIISNLVQLLSEEGQIVINREDEIVDTRSQKKVK